jgi:RNA polymerase sigma factor (sigma-70 family)
MEDYQQQLFPYAYNILGSVDDAKDAVQEAMIKFLPLQKDALNNEKAYLIRMVINQSIAMKERMKRLISGRTWLPEPVATEGADERLNREELLSYSMLVLLEQLNARERTVFILKEAFSFSHEEVAEMLSLSAENSRKLLSRARHKLETHKNQLAKPKKMPPSFLEQYLDVIRRGDLEDLKQLLADDVSLTADGGKKIQVAQAVTVGLSATADLILFVYQTYQQHLHVSYGEVNHQPALLFMKDGAVVICQVFAVTASARKVNAIYSVVDPEKLHHFLPKEKDQSKPIYESNQNS